MSLEFSVDLISDLNLERSEQFDWTGKASSLFCVVAGNVSKDLKKVSEVLEHLGTQYRGVFYIDGSLEHTTISNYENRIEKLTSICKPLQNVIYMHNHVVVLNSIAFVAINGWYTNIPRQLTAEEYYLLDSCRNEDLGYLSNTIKNLQLHRDATKIVVVSSCIPSEHLFYKKYVPSCDGVEPGLALVMDTDHKVSNWLYGGSEIVNDVTFNKRRYVNNPRFKNQPYWPKRIVV